MKKKQGNYITEILGNDVSWWVDANSVTELDECSIEHIEDLIKDGCRQGDLNVSYGKNMQKETNGWWHIINWRDIACELYHVAKGITTDASIKATKRFDDEWTF